MMIERRFSTPEAGFKTLYEISQKPPWRIDDFENRPQDNYNEILLKWARQLPPSPQGIIDVAAGLGIEALFLHQHGFRVYAQDPSPACRKHAVFSIHKGRAERIKFPPNSFSGAILKDTIVFFPPNIRLLVFNKLFQILVPGGSVLLSSQTQYTYRAAVVDKPDSQPYFITPADTDNNIDRWIDEIITLYKKRAIIFEITYPTSPQIIKDLIGENFSSEVIREYSHNDPLANESRWAKIAGFIMICTVNKSS